MYSPDGRYFWDGGKWVAVAPEAPAGTSGESPVPPSAGPRWKVGRKTALASGGGLASVMTVVAVVLSNIGSCSGPASFSVVSATWAGSCDATNGCPVTGTFVNNGGPGSATAIFTITGRDGTDYGSCSVAIPQADSQGTSDASCQVVNALLGHLIATSPGDSLPIRVNAQVQNP